LNDERYDATIHYFCGHCIKKLEPISNRTPEFARAACVVALYRIIRPDCVPMPNPATRGVPRVPPSRLAAPLHSDFFAGGGISKKEWAARARGGFHSSKQNIPDWYIPQPTIS